MDLTNTLEVKKFVYLTLIGIGLLSLDFFYSKELALHDYFQVLIIFFVAQSAILLRIEEYGGEEMRVQMRLVSIGLRMVSALTFLLIMSGQLDDNSSNFYIQFIVLYLVFLTFEITLALTNLRRN